jgi:hypothetical protein
MVIPRLATTHTCRNFDKIHTWGKKHAAGSWRINLTRDEADEIIESTSFSHDPEEDIQGLWERFPGNTFFKHWREHPLADATAGKN